MFTQQTNILSAVLLQLYSAAAAVLLWAWIMLLNFFLYLSNSLLFLMKYSTAANTSPFYVGNLGLLVSSFVWQINMILIVGVSEAR